MNKINVYTNDSKFIYITEDYEFIIGILDLACHLMTTKEWIVFEKAGYNYLIYWFDKKINLIELNDEKFKELMKYV